jgi:hypothetical protein
MDGDLNEILEALKNAAVEKALEEQSWPQKKL